MKDLFSPHLVKTLMAIKILPDYFLFVISPEYIFLERLIIYINEFIGRSAYGGIKKNSQ